MAKEKKRKLLSRFVAYYKPHKLTFAFDMLCSFTFAVSGLLYPMVSQRICAKAYPTDL